MDTYGLATDDYLEADTGSHNLAICPIILNVMTAVP